MTRDTVASTSILRRAFIQFFQKAGHSCISSSPVIPNNDPTLLFTNAGMNQFKDVFLGQTKRDYSRAVTSQKCIRVGGKHNDLENVGHTSRHLTFFEMLGNFSFGDYFKEQAIDFAWKVSTEIFQLDPVKIYPSVFRTDDEAFEIWTKYVPPSRISRLGEKDNFWAMGDTGPCGPCSELYYDRGHKYGDALSPAEDVTAERYLEFWNLVFMQYNKDSSGTQILLPKPSIDTGAGLERVMSLIMGVDTVFETDVLRGLIREIERLSSKKYDLHDPVYAPAFRVIADHIRSLAFAIADGAQPSNTDRGYVLRKIVRRAVRYGKSLGFDKPFLGKLLPALQELMGEHYIELAETQSRAEEILTLEEESFFRTLKRGGTLLSDVLQRAKTESHHRISGDDAFRLKDTYGMPLEEIQLMAHDSNLSIDLDRFTLLEEEARLRSKAAHKMASVEAMPSFFEELANGHKATEFDRTHRSLSGARVIAIVKDGVQVEKLCVNETGEIFFDRTPFYAEMGGQLGDTGVISSSSCRAVVTNCYSPFKGLSGHIVTVQEGEIESKGLYDLTIDESRRVAIEKNHSATHLLNWALQEVLGKHVRQSGSLVDTGHLRFDFSHHKSLAFDEIKEIEQKVNSHIEANHQIREYELPYEEVQKRSDIKQFFGDKYGAIVRVVEIGPSKELCGGTHTKSTGNIGLFRIVKEGSIAAGTRRIEAVTGSYALLYTHEKEKVTQNIAEKLNTPVATVLDRVLALCTEKEVLEKKLKVLMREKLEASLHHVQRQESATHPGSFVFSALLPCTSSDLKDAASELVKKNGNNASIILGCVDGGKAHLFIKIGDTMTSLFPAVDVLKKAMVVLEGNGGGKKESAQGAGKRVDKIEESIQVAINAIIS